MPARLAFITLSAVCLMTVNLVPKSGAWESVDGTWAIAQKEPSPSGGPVRANNR